MSFRSFVLLFSSAALLFGGLVGAQAANNMYRYKDDNGTPSIGASVPPEFVKNGYQILNPSGRVIEVVPPAPTAEELAIREAAAAEAERLKEEARKRAEEDTMLLRVYSTPKEAIRARDRRLQDVDSVIGLKRGNVQVITNQIKEIEAQAATIERSGRTVPSEIHDNIARLKANIDGLEGEIAKIRQERDGVELDFNRKIERLRYLRETRSPKAKSTTGE